jgi:hypothetical protein
MTEMAAKKAGAETLASWRQWRNGVIQPAKQLSQEKA